MDRSVLWVVQQAMTEIGLQKPNAVTSSLDPTVSQMLALFNSAGIEMVLGYPWEELTKQYLFTTQDGVDEYPLPADFSYFLNQTQWDRTNHWPLMGPKTAQEWQWLKGGMLSSGPRIRYRLRGGKFIIHPVPGPSGDPATFTPYSLAMEYVGTGWLQDATLANTYYNEAKSDSDILVIDPWVMVKFIKLKYYEAKGLDTAAFSKDFLGTWEALIGKSKGAPILSLSPESGNMYVGVNNIPDGSWPIGSTS